MNKTDNDRNGVRLFRVIGKHRIEKRLNVSTYEEVVDYLNKEKDISLIREYVDENGCRISEYESSENTKFVVEETRKDSEEWKKNMYHLK